MKRYTVIYRKKSGRVVCRINNEKFKICTRIISGILAATSLIFTIGIAGGIGEFISYRQALYIVIGLIVFSVSAKILELSLKDNPYDL